MKVEIDGELYPLIIKKKRSTKNTYIRVNDNLQIMVTTNYFTTDKFVVALIEKNIKSITRMISVKKKRKINNNNFYYLGKNYDIVSCNNEELIFGDEKVFLPFNFDLDKWYKKQASEVFKVELDKMYNIFKYNIPYPSLTIRNMKTRWGVCNTIDKKVTLNLQLIKKDTIYLDYVIIHELSHLIHPNHSKSFWNVVEVHMPNYKQIRKELRKDE